MPTMVCKSTVAGLSNTWLTTVTFYDRRLHPIQVRSNNHVYYNGFTTSAALTDTKTVVNDFTGAPQVSKVVKQTAATTSITVYTQFTYDQVYRVTAISQKYNTGNFVPVVNYTYNELGQVINKGLGQISSGSVPATQTLNSTYSGNNTIIASSSIVMSTGFSVPSGSTFNAYISTGYLQSVDYRYNIRGQLTTINNSTLSNDGGVTNADNTDLFGMQFLYDQQDSNLGNTPKYNGKLSAVKWMSKDGSGNSSYERAFTYVYDAQDRYRGETYSERPSTSTAATAFTTTHGWDETGITYDLNGNILSLKRNTGAQGSSAVTNIDQLGYSYDPTNPNRLKSMVDSSSNVLGFMGGTGNYAYDANGNLAADPYKGISLISYSSLNRTSKITFTVSPNRYITYVTDANGTVLRKQQYDNVSGVATLQHTTDYVDGFVYLDGTLSYFPMPEGRVVNNGGTLTQEFIITDGQGNARISFNNTGAGGTAKVVQENSYYGFGMIMPNSPVATPTVPNKDLYNGGSEWQNDYANLPDYYQTFNRNYDAALGRFIGVDPEAESTESMSTYQYAGNNPIMNNDPLGNKAVDSGNFGWANEFSNEMNSTSVYGGGPSGSYAASDYSAFWGPALNYLNDIATSINGTDITEVSMNGAQLGQGAIIENAISQGLVNQSSDGELAYTNVSAGGNSSGTQSYMPVIKIPKVYLNIFQMNTLGVSYPLNDVLISANYSNSNASQGDDGDGYQFTTITRDITVPQINGPFFHSSERFYAGTREGKEGESFTMNATKDLKGGGLDESKKIFGLSFGFGVDSEGFNFSFGFSNSTYTLGASKEGITYGSSMINGTNLTGQTTTFTPTPLSGFLVVGAAVFSPIMKIAPYVVE